jgi:hypothetical protein
MIALRSPLSVPDLTTPETPIGTAPLPLMPAFRRRDSHGRTAAARDPGPINMRGLRRHRVE